MSVIRPLLLALALLLALPGSPARAGQIDDIRRKGELVIGVLGVDEPNSFIDPATREFVGYEVDLAKAVARHLGVRPVLKQVAVAARIPELQQGGVDLLAASLTHTRERESQIDFSLTEVVMGQKVMVKRSSGIQHVAELAGRKVLTVTGGTQGPNLLRVVPSAQLVTFETSPQAFLALQQGKGAGYVNDEASLRSNFSRLGKAADAYLILPENLSIEPMGLGIRKGEAAMKQAVDETLRALEASGEAERIFLKWYGPGTRLNLPRREFRIDSDKVER